MLKIKKTLQENKGFRKEKTAAVRFSKSIFLGITLLVLGQNEVKAQLTATGQIRERTEVRAGQGTLLKESDKAGLFTSQRTRLNIGFTGYRYKVYASLQDVRVFGQDRSSINKITVDANDGILFHEAWAEVMLIDTLSKIQNMSLKVGRQEIAYDDQKVLGALDWLQQGRKHDAIVFKYANKGWFFDAGVAFNQNSEKNSTTIFDPSVAAYPTGYSAGTNGVGALYKSFQYAYLGRKFFFGNLSFLYFKDDFNKVVAGTAVQGVFSRNTIGLYYNVNPTRKINLTGSFYHQGGHNKDGRSISANLASITSTYQVGRKLFVGPGVDYLSGTDGTKAITANSDTNTFDPLYGTPHKFWGTMDYFYAASPFGQQGLLNYFFKVKYNASDKLSLLLDVHGFETANKLATGAKSYLGTEVDLTAKYNFTKIINIEAGYSMMKAKKSLAGLKGVLTPDLSPQFAYVMLTIKPDFLATKKQ
jgi:hypothetical protein